MINKIQLIGGRSDGSYPAFYETRESGAFLTQIRIIANGDFTPKRVLFINNTRSMPQTIHALFPAVAGDIVLQASVNSKKEETYQILSIADIQVNPNNKKFIFTCDEIEKSHDLNELVDRLSTLDNKELIEAFLNAGRSKLYSSIKGTFYAQNVLSGKENNSKTEEKTNH